MEQQFANVFVCKSFKLIYEMLGPLAKLLMRMVQLSGNYNLISVEVVVGLVELYRISGRRVCRVL